MIVALVSEHGSTTRNRADLALSAVLTRGDGHRNHRGDRKLQERFRIRRLVGIFTAAGLRGRAARYRQIPTSGCEENKKARHIRPGSMYGSPGWIRTNDQRINSPLRYRCATGE